MIKLKTITSYLKEGPKKYKSRNTPLDFSWHHHFIIKNQQLLFYQETQIKIAFEYIIYNSFKSFCIFNGFFANMGAILMMSTKVTTLGVLKMKILWKKIYDVLISVYDVTSKILSRGSNAIVDVVMWPKFANFIISKRKGIMTSILQRFD